MTENIKVCPNCRPHEFQDSKYGKNVRVHTMKPEGKIGRCTVCGKDA